MFRLQFSTFESATSHLCRVVLKMLNSLLVHADPRVVKVVCNAIEFLLKFVDVRNICGESNQDTKQTDSQYEFVADDYPYLSIFSATSPKSAAIYSAPTTSSAHFDKIFADHENSQHETWIKAFVNEMFRMFHDKHLSLVSTAHVMWII